MTYAIYPLRLAAMAKARAGEKYRPSNGTEGYCFFAAWCCKCQRDKSMREGVDFFECGDSELCKIIADTFAYDVDHPEYPAEWRIGKDGQPCCTAFVPAGQPLPTPRCSMTQDMFGETGGAA